MHIVYAPEDDMKFTLLREALDRSTELYGNQKGSPMQKIANKSWLALSASTLILAAFPVSAQAQISDTTVNSVCCR